MRPTNLFFLVSVFCIRLVLTPYVLYLFPMYLFLAKRMYYTFQLCAHNTLIPTQVVCVHLVASLNSLPCNRRDLYKLFADLYHLLCFSILNLLYFSQSIRFYFHRSDLLHLILSSLQHLYNCDHLHHLIPIHIFISLLFSLDT